MKYNKNELAEIMLNDLLGTIDDLYGNLFKGIYMPSSIFGYSVEDDPEVGPKIVSDNGFVEVIADLPDADEDGMIEMLGGGARYRKFLIVTILEDDTEDVVLYGTAPAARRFVSELIRMEVAFASVEPREIAA